MIRGGDDDILPRQRERDDIDGGFPGLHGGKPDALELLAVECPAVRRVGPIRCAESQPVDQHDSSVPGQP